MKANLLLIICFLSKGAFSQLAMVQTVTGPQMGYVSMPVGAISRVDNYYHYDLNKNSYYGGNRDIIEIDRVIPSGQTHLKL